MGGQMSGGDWKPFEKRVVSEELKEERIKIGSDCVHFSRLQLVDTPPLLGLFR